MAVLDDIRTKLNNIINIKNNCINLLKNAFSNMGETFNYTEKLSYIETIVDYITNKNDDGIFKTAFALPDTFSFPKGVRNIKSYCFKHTSTATSTASVTIPASVTEIGDKVFGSYTPATIYMQSSTPPVITATSFVNSKNNSMLPTSIVIPAGSLSNYINATNWNILPLTENNN